MPQGDIAQLLLGEIMVTQIISLVPQFPTCYRGIRENFADKFKLTCEFRDLMGFSWDIAGLQIHGVKGQVCLGLVHCSPC